MGDQASNLNPLALAMLLVLAYLIWSLPRRFAVCPLLAMVALMPMGQKIELFGLNFYFFRILLLVGLLRVMVRGESTLTKWTRVDKYFAWWVIVSIIFGTLVKPSMELFVNRLGNAFNAAGSYYFIRCVILDLADIVTNLRMLAYISVPVAAFMLVERVSMHNPLAIFGGVPDLSAIREGHVRSQGAFRHAILAGTFGATEFPLFVSLWFYETRKRWVAFAGVVASLVIVGTAGSSGAIIALAGAMAGLALWKWREYLHLLRRGTVIALILLAILMNAPLWYLIAKMSDIAGGGGWHRAFVIDTAVVHLREWWLFGTTYTAHWGPGGEVIAADPNMMDITNQFVVEGVNGGLLKLVLFVALIILCFKNVGQRLRSEEDEQTTRFLFWGMGSCLFAHCLSFMSIPYFDQMIIIWFFLLACMSIMLRIPGG